MNASIRWMAGNRVAANLLMWALLLSGALYLGKITKETFPTVEFGMVGVSIAYPSASPSEVEHAVCARAEEALQGLEGLERSTATATEGLCYLRNEISLGYDTQELMDEIQARIDAIDNFPDSVERPRYQNLKWRNKVISLVLYGPLGERTLKRLTEDIRDELYQLPALRQLDLSGLRQSELHIELSPSVLQQHQLSLRQVADRIRQFSLDLPSGQLQNNEGETLLRAQAQATSAQDFAQIPVLSHSDGSQWTLGALAHLNDGFEERPIRSLFNNQPAAFIHVYRVGEQSVLEVADAVHRYVEDKRATLPAGLSIAHWDDRSQMFRSRMTLLTRNAITGLALVFLVLLLFMRLRLAFWTSMGLPVSFMGALVVLPWFGGSINMISMFAFILVLGIVVDDAIVVGENIYTRQMQGQTGLKGAILGSTEVAKPVVFAVLTTIVTFIPVLALPGTDGQLWRQIPLVVIATLLFSLVESLYILPAHLANSRYHPEQALRRGWRHPLETLQSDFERGLHWTLQRLYRPALSRALHWRYSTVALFVALMMLAIGLMHGGHLKLVFFPRVDRDSATAALTMPEGTPEAQTLAILTRIEAAAQTLNQQLGQEVVRYTNTTLGAQPISTHRGSRESGAHLGEVAVAFSPAEARALSTSELLQLWREQIGEVPEARALSFNSAIGSAGADIDFELSHRDLATLQAATLALKQRMQRYAGVSETNDSLRRGKRELLLQLRPGSEHLGITLGELAQQVREGFHGIEVQSLQRDGEEVSVWLRYPKQQRQSTADLKHMPVRLADGQQLPFAVIAEAIPSQGPATITLREQKRIASVTAVVDPKRGNDTEITRALQQHDLPALVDQFPGLAWRTDGRSRNRDLILDSMLRNSLLALLGVYALMAIPFRSYAQPFIIMSAIPFGLLGAVLGHLLLRLDLSILSLSGMIAVAGVVVNDNLVLVDRINQQRARGVALASAVHDAGIARFRPIILTSLTTFAGLTPLMLEKSTQAQFLIPMGVSLSFGVLFATVVSLLLVPASYLIIEDIRALLTRHRTEPPHAPSR